MRSFIRLLELLNEAFNLHKRDSLLNRDWLTLEETAFALDISTDKLRKIENLVPKKLGSKSYYLLKDIKEVIMEQSNTTIEEEILKHLN